LTEHRIIAACVFSCCTKRSHWCDRLQCGAHNYELAPRCKRQRWGRKERQRAKLLQPAGQC